MNREQTTISQHYQHLVDQVPENLREAAVEAWDWLRHFCQTPLPLEDNLEVTVPTPPFPAQPAREPRKVILTIYPANRNGGRSLTVEVTAHSARLMRLEGYGGLDWQVAPIIVQALSYALNNLERWRLYREVLKEVARGRIDWEANWGDDQLVIATIEEAVRGFRERHGSEDTGPYKWMTMVAWANAGLLRWCFVPVTTGLSPDCPS